MEQRTVDLFKKICKKALKPIPKLTVSQWADKYRMLSAESSAEAGKWRTDRAPYQREIMDSFTADGVHKVIVKSASQIGKALDVNTPVLTTKGFKPMGELTTKDLVYTEQGVPCKVLALSEVWKNRPCYEITFTDGAKIVADEEHLWTVNRMQRKGFKAVTLPTKVIMNDYKVGNRYAYVIPLAKPIQTEDKALPIPPYTFGYWLGDGNSCSAQITVSKKDLEIMRYIEQEGIYCRIVKDGGNHCTIHLKTAIEHSGYFATHCKRGHDMEVLGYTKAGRCAECGRQHSLHNKWKGVNDIPVDPIIHEETTVISKLIKLNVKNNKHIPEAYLLANEEQRLELLKGLMDSDGHITKKGTCEITIKSKQLIEDISKLLSGLSIKHSIRDKRATMQYKGKQIDVPVYRITFTVYKDRPVFRLKRKEERLKEKDGVAVNEVYRRRIKEIKPVQPRDTVCIQVDNPTHLFLAGYNLIPTHNSDIMNNVIGRFAHLDPAPMLMIQPTIEMAQDYSKSRIAPMIRDTAVLAKTFTETKTRESSNTILSKVFPGGRIAMGGANSPAGLASRPIRICLADEVDRFPASAGGEGDPVDLAAKRMTTYWNWTLGLFSTPTIKGASRIEEEYLNGTQEEWQHKCPNCGEYHLITHRNIFTKHEETVDANKVKHVIVTDVKWRCPDCGYDFSEADMKATKQKYIAANAPALAKGVRSFFVNCFASPWLSWNQVMQEWLEAKGDPEREKVVYNTRFGEAYERAGAFEDTDKFLRRRENYGAELPDGVLVLTAAVDTQDNRLEYEIRGWGYGEETWGIKKDIILGVPDDPKVWEMLDEQLDRIYTFADGSGLTVSRTLIDTGGHYTQEVYKYCMKNIYKQRFPLKGSNQPGQPLLGKTAKGNIVGTGHTIPLATIGTEEGKQYIMDRLAIDVPGPKYFHFPLDGEEHDTLQGVMVNRGYDEIYFKGLISEQLLPKVEKGRVVYRWVNIAKDKRNEPLDLCVYNLACLRTINPDFARLDAERKVRISQPKQKTDNMELLEPRKKLRKRAGAIRGGDVL